MSHDDAAPQRPGLPPGLALAWGETSPGRRGPKPGQSVEKIVDAAVVLADSQGLDALSLPKLAASIGVSTNALYRYVSSKDELLVLVRDAGWGAPPDSIRAAASWRDAATVWVHAVVERYGERPWLLEVPVPGSPMTPRLLSWLEVLLESTGSTGLSDRERLRCALLLDGYAYSTASLVRKLQVAATEPQQAAAAYEFLLPRLRAEGFPVLAGMLSGGAYGNGDPVSAADFGLQRILDGIEALIGSARDA